MKCPATGDSFENRICGHYVVFTTTRFGNHDLILGEIGTGDKLPNSNPYSLDLTHAHVIVAPVINPGGLRVRMAGHPLRHFDTSAIRQVVRNPSGAEGVAAYRGFDAGRRRQRGGAHALTDPALSGCLPCPLIASNPACIYAAEVSSNPNSSIANLLPLQSDC